MEKIQPHYRKNRASWSLLYFAFVIAGNWLIASCTFDKGELFAPEQSQCDSSTVSFSSHIDTILKTNCLIGCHAGVFPESGPDLDTYELVKVQALNGKLLCAVNWGGSCTPMPYMAVTKIDSADRALIGQWVSEGACP